MPGLKLRKKNIFKDHKRYSFRKTFGSAYSQALIDIDLDLNLSNFNQNLPNPQTGGPALPNACTCFARADAATNEDRIIYDPEFTYRQSCYIENVPFGAPLYLETPYKSGRTDGLKALGEPEGQELNHRRGPYFEIHPSFGQDYFDALWSALLIGGKPITLASVWYPEMTNLTIVDAVSIRPTNDGHAIEICAVKTTDAPRMKIKWWGGSPKYFGRSAINSLMSVSGADCLTDVDGKATISDLKSIGFITLLRQELLNFLQRLLALQS